MLVVLLVMAAAAVGEERDPAAQQIIMFKEKTLGPIGIMTTSAGAPVPHSEALNTLNTRLLNNEFFMDTMTHLVRERIPERVVHAKAGGAFGYFEVTHDISHICKAKLFSKIGKKTPVAARFSPVVVERGGSDTSRDARGYAVKFYTEEGNFDIVGFSTPMYVYNDPRLFPTFVRAQKKNPATNLFDANTVWDFLTIQPESIHMFLLIFGDRGIPASYRNMPGFGIHTYQVENDRGDIHFVRFHFIPDAGIKNLRSEEARKIGAEDADYLTRDLYKAIGNGEFPSWTVSVQVLSFDDVKHAKFNVFDVTNTIPLNEFPLKEVGKMVLNKNAVNYFAEIEQLAYSPANLVPGILGGPDKVFEARRLAYRDAQYYRLGANFHKIPVNCPFRSQGMQVYNRDGRAPVKDNGKDIPNYFPNSYNGPVPYDDKNRIPLIEITEPEPNNFRQATELYMNEMTKEERSRLVENVLYSLGSAASFLQERAVKIFNIIHPDLGYRIEQGLRSNKTKNYHDTYQHY
ncbi:catalase-like [Maniola hyperantus]|uniref:catalase-like n=1 Tax=Aphantopus hyperantus TaxID=2795564 RepID=UPI0015694146|nr:catalase-like [Maniola hyperantus]